MELFRAHKSQTIGEGSIRNTLDPNEGDKEDNRLLLDTRRIPVFVILIVHHRSQYGGHTIDHVEAGCDE